MHCPIVKLNSSILATLLLTSLAASHAQEFAAEPDPAPFHVSLAAAVEQAHAKLWSGHVDAHGVIMDYIGEIPTPDDCAQGRPNAIGWRSPIANGAMFTGLYLPAACERAHRTQQAEDKAKAARLAQGLMKLSSVSDVPGFIARGLATDGRSHYPAGSDDQTHPWFLGLHAYLQSGLPDAAERHEIVSKMTEVASALEAAGWKCPCDGAFRGQSRGPFKGHLFRDAVRYLHLLRLMHEVTRDRVWLDRYRQALAERPEHSPQTRAEICAIGYAHDREAIKALDEIQLWIYVGSQAALAQLAAWETDPAIRTQFREGLARNAANARHSLETYRQFDHRDSSTFGHADWRAVYSTWFPQRTQADAEKLAKAEDKSRAGQRKDYEVRRMKNPLAAAAIIALTDVEADRAALERVLRHYDYSQLHLSEFFFAEYAHYALDPIPQPAAAQPGHRRLLQPKPDAGRAEQAR